MEFERIDMTLPITDRNRIIVALDVDNENDAFQLLDQLDSQKCRVKVGKQLFTSCGPDLVRQLVSKGFDVFLDLKYHDIPNTVAGAVKAAADLGVWMVNIHASICMWLEDKRNVAFTYLTSAYFEVFAF